MILLEKRSPKITGVTTKHKEMENCLGKAKFTSAEGCAGTQAQQAPGADHTSSFIFLMQ
jgi:hypothetical protein